jgi:putative ABC transport system permease protein
LAGLLAVLLAVVAVSWQTWNVAKKNPVESLRYE